MSKKRKQNLIIMMNLSISNGDMDKWYEEYECKNERIIDWYSFYTTKLNKNYIKYFSMSKASKSEIKQLLQK